VPSTIDHYAILGVTRSADQREIAAAYRRLARTHHPDVSPASEAVDRMRAINTAYATLSNPIRRAAYDASLPRGGSWSGYGPGASRTLSYSAPAQRVQPRTSMGVARAVGLGIVVLVVGFGAVACLLSSQVPTTTRPDGVVVLPRATATALALAGQSQTNRTRAARVGSLTADTTSVPSAVRDSPVLRDFPLPVLLPPSNRPPFDTLAIETPRVSGAACGTDPQCVPRYVIDYGQPASSAGQIAGFGGRAVFDADLASANAACGGGATVCSSPAVAGRGEVHYARELSVGGAAAIARHQACCPGPYSMLTWYDVTADVSYRLQLSGAVAAAIDGGSGTQDHVAATAALVRLASDLVRLQ
jgi:hypothetical protein